MIKNTKLFDELGCIRPHLCHAQSLYGDIPDQPMFTCVVLCNDNSKVINVMLRISNEIKKYFKEYGMTNLVMRNKIETKDREVMHDLNDTNNDEYYEYHWKIEKEGSNLGHMLTYDKNEMGNSVNIHRTYLTDEYFY